MKISYRVIYITVALAIGIWISKVYSVAFYCTLPLLIISMIMGLHSLYREKRPLFHICIFLTALFMGAVLEGVKEAEYKGKAACIKEGFCYTKLLILKPGEERGSQVVYESRLLSIGRERDLGGRNIRVLLRIGKNRKLHVKPEAGDIIGLSGVCSKADTPTNPGQFDYREYLKLQGINGIVQLPNTGRYRRLGRQKPGFFISIVFSVREKLSEVIKTSLPENEGRLLAGMILGQRLELPPQIRDDFKKTGALHILAASGLHASIVIAFCLCLISLVGIKGKIRFLLAVPPLIFYAFLAGGSPSIVRASIMGIFYLAASALERDYSPLNSLFLAALGMLIVNPFNLFMAGFQLSFAAVAGIIVLFEPVYSLFPSCETVKKGVSKVVSPLPDSIKKIAVKYIPGTYYYILSLVIISVIAQVALSPILAWYFNQISLVSIAANLVMVPMAGVCIPLGILGGFLGMVFKPLGHLVLTPLQLLLSAGLSWASRLAAFPMAVLWIPRPSPVFLVLYYSLISVLALPVKLLEKHRRASVAIALFALSIYLGFYAYQARRTHRLVVFNNRKTAAVLVDRGNQSVLYLFARKTRGGGEESEINRNVLPYLKERGIFNIPVLVIAGEKDCGLPLGGEILEWVYFRNVFIYPGTGVEKKIASFPVNTPGKEMNFYFLRENFYVQLDEALLEIGSRSDNLLSYTWSGKELRILLGNSLNFPYSGHKGVKINPGIFIFNGLEKENLEEFNCLKRNYGDSIFISLFGSGIASGGRSRKRIQPAGVLSPGKDGAIILNLNGGKIAPVRRSEL